MISIIVAIQKKDNGIGYQGDLLYHLPDDMKRFRKLTEGNVVIMGRKTWESLPDSVRPLPDRTNVVITRNRDYRAPGAHVVHSMDEALETPCDVKLATCDYFIIGGAEVYQEALPLADRLYLTIIDGDQNADTFFPNYSEFTKVIEQEEKTDEKIGVEFTYVTLER